MGVSERLLCLWLSFIDSRRFFQFRHIGLKVGGAGLDDLVCVAWVFAWEGEREWEREGEREREGARVMLELVSANVELDLSSAARVSMSLLKCVLDDDGSRVDTGESIVDTGEFTTPSEVINGG